MVNLARVIVTSAKKSFDWRTGHNDRVFLSCIIMILFIISALSMSPEFRASAYSSQTSRENAAYASCNQRAYQQINAQSASANIVQGISTATSASQVQQLEKQFQIAYETEYNTWQIVSLSSCSIAWVAAYFVFDYHSPNGSLEQIVVTENPGMTTVDNVSLRQAVYMMYAQPFQSSYTSGTWSGYEFYAYNSGVQTQVYRATGEWTEPSVSSPGSNACLFTHCDVSNWEGLANAVGGGNGYLVQAGSDSGLYCTIVCSYYYYLWYEFYPNPSNSCLNVSPGDDIAVNVQNEAVNGGSSNNYDIYLSDDTTGQLCSPIIGHNFSQMGLPYYAEYITSRPNIGGSFAKLPQFGSFTNNNANIYYAGNEHSIYVPYQNLWYNSYTMNNGCGNNINNGPVQAQDSIHGEFTVSWATSCGT